MIQILRLKPGVGTWSTW